MIRNTVSAPSCHSKIPLLAAFLASLMMAMGLLASAASGAESDSQAEQTPTQVRREASDTTDKSEQVEPIDDAPKTAELWYFWRDNCPFCVRASEWLSEMDETWPQLTIHKVEVVKDSVGRARFIDMMAERGKKASGVPAFILDDKSWVGFSQPLADHMGAEISAKMGVLSAPPPKHSTISLGPLGTIDVGAQSMAVATVLIAFVDGFNPCSLWVLSILLAMILGTRSRARIAAVGLTFLSVTAAIYGLFIVGLFAAFMVASHLGWIQIAVGILALLFGAINVKDYFAYKQGLSFSIPDRFKPRIYRGARSLRKERPLPIMLAITVAMAAGVAFIELPCTAGFPVLWTTLMSEANLGSTAFAGHLVIYLLVYLSVEIAILAGALITLRASRLQESHGRTLKLFGGMVMVALAIVLLVDPSIMENVVGSVVVMGLAVLTASAVLIGDRWRRSRKQPEPPVSKATKP